MGKRINRISSDDEDGDDDVVTVTVIRWMQCPNGVTVAICRKLDVSLSIDIYDGSFFE